MTVWATQRDGKLEGRRLAKKLMTAVEWGEEMPLIGLPATEENTFVTGWVLRVLLRWTCEIQITHYTHTHTLSQKHTCRTPPR